MRAGGVTTANDKCCGSVGEKGGDPTLADDGAADDDNDDDDANDEPASGGGTDEDGTLAKRGLGSDAAAGDAVRNSGCSRYTHKNGITNQDTFYKMLFNPHPTKVARIITI